MPKEIKKFLLIFSQLAALFTILVIVILLLVAEHWIIALCIAVPFLAGIIAYVETDIPKALNRMIVEKDE